MQGDGAAESDVDDAQVVQESDITSERPRPPRIPLSLGIPIAPPPSADLEGELPEAVAAEADVPTLITDVPIEEVPLESAASDALEGGLRASALALDAESELALQGEPTQVTTPPTIRSVRPPAVTGMAPAVVSDAIAALAPHQASPPPVAAPLPVSAHEVTTRETSILPAPNWPQPLVAAPPALQWPSDDDEGRIEDHVVAAVLCAAAKRSDEVTLDIDIPGQAISIVLLDGVIVDARERAVRDPLLALLLDDQHVRADQRDAIERNLPPGRRLSSADVVDAGVVAADDVSALHALRVRRTLGAALAAEEGAWRVRLDAASVPSGQGARVPVFSAVWDAARELISPTELQRVVGSLGEERPRWVGTRPTRSQFPSSRAQRALLASIDGETRVRELRASGGDDALRVLYALLASARISL